MIELLELSATDPYAPWNGRSGAAHAPSNDYSRVPTLADYHPADSSFEVTLHVQIRGGPARHFVRMVPTGWGKAEELILPLEFQLKWDPVKGESYLVATSIGEKVKGRYWLESWEVRREPFEIEDGRFVESFVDYLTWSDAAGVYGSSWRWIP